MVDMLSDQCYAWIVNKHEEIFGSQRVQRVIRLTGLLSVGLLERKRMNGLFVCFGFLSPLRDDSWLGCFIWASRNWGFFFLLYSGGISRLIPLYFFYLSHGFKVFLKTHGNQKRKDVYAECSRICSQVLGGFGFGSIFYIRALPRCVWAH